MKLEGAERASAGVGAGPAPSLHSARLCSGRASFPRVLFVKLGEMVSILFLKVVPYVQHHYSFFMY